MCLFLLSRKVIQLYIYIHILFHILLHYGLSQDTEYSSLYHTVGPCCLSWGQFFQGGNGCVLPPVVSRLNFIILERPLAKGGPAVPQAVWHRELLRVALGLGI